MRIVSFNVNIPVTFDSSKKTLEANTKYIMSDVTLQKIVNSNRRKVVDVDEDFYFRNEWKRYAGEDLTEKSLITIRNGALGDALFQMPGLKTLKEKYPCGYIAVAYNPNYSSVYQELDYVDEVYDIPLELSEFEKFDYFVAYEGETEGMNSELENIYQIHNRCLYVDPLFNIPELVMPSGYGMNKKSFLTHPANKLVVIAYKASSYIRSVDYNLYRDIIMNSPEGVEYYIAGNMAQRDDIKSFVDQINALIKQFKKKVIVRMHASIDIWKVIDLVRVADLVISPDSGLLHIAGAMKTPMIGLYGAFPSALRISTYENAIGLDTVSNCKFGRGQYKSCFQNTNAVCDLAVKFSDFYSPCMSVITWPIVIQSMQKLGVIK